MARIQRVQDAVHGLMEFEGMETSIVEVLRAKELQRLRRVRQLGLAHLVFPCAEHSRLVHCIGAAYLAIRFAKQLGQSTRDTLFPFLRPGATAVRDLALAALAHDIGHGPLSHVWERQVIGDNFDRSKWIGALDLSPEPELLDLKWHELVAQGLLAWEDGELHQLLEQHEIGSSIRIRQLLLGKYHPQYLPRLLSSDVDVDRCDFILRDAHQTGVAYGRYDINWLVSTVTIGKTSNDRLVVGFDRRKAPPVIEQFLVARRALYHTVFLHKTVCAAEAMIGLLLKRIMDVPDILEKGIERIPLFEPYRKVIKGEALTAREVIGLDDYSLWVLIQSLADRTNIDRTAADLARRIIARDLFKIVPCSPTCLQDFIGRPDAWERLYDTVRPYCQGEADYYIHRDNVSFEMMSDQEPKWAYFIDSGTSNSIATPIREHERMRPHWTEPETIHRLFAPREAIDSIRRAVESP